MWNMLLIGARFLQFAGALVLLGSCLFQLYAPQSPASPESKPARWPRRVLVISALIAVLGTLLWVMAETVLFSGDAADGTDPAAVWLVFSATRFGRACLWRIGLLLAAVAIAWLLPRMKGHWVLQSMLASVSVATFAWTGHGAATAGRAGMLHLASDLLHLWAGGAWLGALVPLAIVILRARRSRLSADTAAMHGALRGFSAIAIAMVAVLVMSGLINSWFMVGSADWRASAATDYGAALQLKLALFVAMLVLAAANRFWLLPRQHIRGLQISILIEIGLGMLVLLAVGLLGTLPPPAAGD